LTDELSKMCQMFEEAEEATREAREKSERDRDYTDLKQWTSTEEAALKNRNQPVVVFDRTKRKVNSLLGLEKQTRKDPRAFPRNQQDEASAHAATDAIRYVCDDNRWDDKRSSAAENLIIEGTAIIKVGVRQVRDGLDPDIIHVKWDRYFFDPHSAEFDFADKAYDGEVIWKDLDDAIEKYPDRRDALEVTLSSSTLSDTYDDRPKHKLWADPKRKRVRIVEMFYKKKGVWHFCIFTKGGFLVDPAPSPYLDEERKPENPYKAVSLYIDRDNNRYGEVRGMIGPQDEINKRRSKALHLINERQVRVSPSVGMDKRKIQKEMSDPRGVIIGEAGEVEVLPTNDMAAANLQMLQEAKNEIDLLGLNAASIGKSQQELSGKAIIAQQQGGMLEAATILDRVRTLSLAVYRAVWNRIQQNWTAERWIRVTDDERNTRFVGLNRPITALEAQAKQLGVNQENFQQFVQEAPEQAQQLAMFAQSPMAQQVVGVENNVTELDVDINVDEGMDTPTIAAEQFEQLVQMAGQGLPIPPDVLIEASSLRNKDKLLEMMKQGPSPEQVEAQKIQLAGEAAKVEETHSKTALNIAKTATEEVKPMVEGLRAGAQPQPGAMM
jgi:hypothetical protein